MAVSFWEEDGVDFGWFLMRGKGTVNKVQQVTRRKSAISTCNKLLSGALFFPHHWRDLLQVINEAGHFGVTTLIVLRAQDR